MSQPPLESVEIDGVRTLVFAGTQVPFQELLDCLRREGSVEAFLAQRPAITREAVLAGLAHVAKLGARQS